jgi:hypothetical protein
MAPQYYTDKNGNLRIKSTLPAPAKLTGSMIWRRTTSQYGECEDIPVTVISDDGAWVRVQTEAGSKHKVRRHNLRPS